jgi:D-galactarolactone isomerase
VWASNWPHPGQATPPTAAELVALRDRWLPTDELRRRVLVDNPAALYDF